MAALSPTEAAMTRMRRIDLLLVWTVVVLSVSTRPAAAQWGAGVEVAAYRFWGGAKAIEADPDQGSVSLPRPYRPTIVGLRLERERGPWAAGVEFYHGGVSIALEDAVDVLVFKDQGSVWGAAPEIQRRTIRLDGGSALWLGLGPTLELWHLAPQNRVRLGVHAALAAVVPLGAHFDGIVRAAGAVTPNSIFLAQEIGPPLHRVAMWRRGVSGGVMYRF